MKKHFYVLAAVLTAFLMTACGSNAPKEDLAGKTAPVVEAGSSGAKWKVTFRYVLDKTGYEAVKKVITHEIKKAGDAKNQKLADQLKTILRKFDSDPAKVVKGVSVCGASLTWNPKENKLTETKEGKFQVFSIKNEWEFSGEKEEYKFVFSLNATDDVLNQAYIWVPDPMASEFKDDGFGGKNSMLAIPGFKASDDKKDDKKDK